MLTAKEKAARYDALQTAIKYTIKGYRKRSAEANERYKEGATISIIGAYNKGLSDGYNFAISDLERWIE